MTARAGESCYRVPVLISGLRYSMVVSALTPAIAEEKASIICADRNGGRFEPVHAMVMGRAVRCCDPDAHKGESPRAERRAA